MAAVTCGECDPQHLQGSNCQCLGRAVSSSSDQLLGMQLPGTRRVAALAWCLETHVATKHWQGSGMLLVPDTCSPQALPRLP